MHKQSHVKYRWDVTNGFIFLLVLFNHGKIKDNENFHWDVLDRLHRLKTINWFLMLHRPAISCIWYSSVTSFSIHRCTMLRSKVIRIHLNFINQKYSRSLFRKKHVFDILFFFSKFNSDWVFSFSFFRINLVKIHVKPLLNTPFAIHWSKVSMTVRYNERNNLRWMKYNLYHCRSLLEKVANFTKISSKFKKILSNAVTCQQ